MPLEHWFITARNAGWKNFADIKRDFKSVDSVGNQRYIFNIKGKNYKLVVVMQFLHGYIYIRFVGTHAEYARINCKTI